MSPKPYVNHTLRKPYVGKGNSKNLRKNEVEGHMKDAQLVKGAVAANNISIKVSAS